MKNAISWFEIPVTDFARAKKFYEAMYNKEVIEMDMGGTQYGMLPYDNENEGVGGGIIANKDETPTALGVLIYLNGGDDLSVPLAKVEENGGKILVPKTNIGENGFMAQILDTEGNRIALHSFK
jgi:predicted enzyme related to lactoylglutathione lyase